MNLLTIALIIFGLFCLWILITYNNLIGLKNSVGNSFSGIDVQLKRRADLIPNLINTVKGYAKHEREVLESLTQARTSIMNGSANSNINQMAQGENMLNSALKSVFAVAENYPDLKANENYLKLQEELSETEDQIAASRRIYNENVVYFNNKIQMVPSNIIASLFNFKEEQFFKIQEPEKKVVEVNY